MLNRINIDFFANGYSLISGGDCFDLPVATIIRKNYIIIIWRYK